MFYTPALRKNFGDTIRFARKNEPETSSNLDLPGGANGGNSKMVLDYLRSKYAERTFRPEYLLVNAGLHDIKRDVKTKAIAISFDEYERNISAIEELARRNGSHLIWINTTPVDDARHNRLSKAFLRYDADVRQCNAIADKVLRKRAVPIIDLYTFTAKNDATAHYIDHVHFDEAMRALQAAYIFGFVSELMQAR